MPYQTPRRPGYFVRCLRCGNTWTAKTPKPSECPRCGSSRWNEAKEPGKR